AAAGSVPELEPAAMAGESEAPPSPEAGREPRPQAPLPWEAAPAAEPEPRPLAPRAPALRPAAAQASAAVATPSRLRTGLRSVARLVTPSPREPEQPPVRPPAEAEPLEAWSPAEAGPAPAPAADVLPLPTR